jgi:hypothetical protein
MNYGICATDGIHFHLQEVWTCYTETDTSKYKLNILRHTVRGLTSAVVPMYYFSASWNDVIHLEIIVKKVP